MTSILDIDIIYKSLKTLKEMLNDRNIDTSNIDNIEIPELKTLINQNTSCAVIILDINENFRVLYSLSKFKVADIKKYLTEKNINHIMIITKGDLTPNNRKSLDMADYSNIDFEYFNIKELMFNISKHVLVPLHEIIHDPKEISHIMNKHRIKVKTQFPLITKEDPMARYLHAKSGDLIKITRDSVTSGSTTVFRYCI